MSRLTGAHHDFGAKIMEINPRTQIISLPWFNGGGGGVVAGTPPRIVDMFQYFETILPLVESL